MLEILGKLSADYWMEYKRQLPSLTTFSHQVSSQEILHRIDLVVYQILSQLLGSEQPQVTFAKPQASFDPLTGTNRPATATHARFVLSENINSVKTFARFLKVLEVIQSLLISGSKATKREIYYRAPELFSTQTASDAVIEKVSWLLQVPRQRLNILSAGKGLVAGALTYYESGVKVKVGNRIHRLPNDLDQVTGLQPAADFVLVLEKDTALSKLVDEDYFSERRCIAITGCGYPDLPTREFLRRLIEEWSHLPVLVLTDCDPHGFHILCTYAFGSEQRVAECDNLALPTAHWLGVHSGDCGDSGMPLTAKDMQLSQKLLSKLDLTHVPLHYVTKRLVLWREVLSQLVESNCKYEIEGVLATSSLSAYVDDKLASGAWL